MARFDVYEYGSKSVPLVVEVQTDLLSHLATCVVVPLVPEAMAKREAMAKLKPVIEIDGRDYILMTTDVAALPRANLGVYIENIEATYRQEITDAVDFLFQGF